MQFIPAWGWSPDLIYCRFLWVRIHSFLSFLRFGNFSTSLRFQNSVFSHTFPNRFLNRCKVNGKPGFPCLIKRDTGGKREKGGEGGSCKKPTFKNKLEIGSWHRCRERQTSLKWNSSSEIFSFQKHLKLLVSKSWKSFLDGISPNIPFKFWFVILQNKVGLENVFILVL